jgi:hypothetical protein
VRAPRLIFLLRAPVRFFSSCCLVLIIAPGRSPVGGVWIWVSYFGSRFRLPCPASICASYSWFPLSSSVLPPKVFAFPFVLPQDSFLDLLACVDFAAGPRSVRLLWVLALGSFTVLDSTVVDRPCSPLPYWSASEQGSQRVDFGSRCLGLHFCRRSLANKWKPVSSLSRRIRGSNFPSSLSDFHGCFSILPARCSMKCL